MFVWGITVIGKNIKTAVKTNKPQKASNINDTPLVQETKKAVETYFCSECGKETKTTSKHCPECGTKME